jgi:microtubule-associated protein-like 6
VHGYRGHDCRNNLHFSSAGDAVFPAASVVVLAGPAPEGGRRRQRFYTGHSDDVLSLAKHPAGILFASGQKAFLRKGAAAAACIHVWDSSTLCTRARLAGVHAFAIVSLAFSPDGSRIISCGIDDLHTVAIWDWDKKTLLVAVPCSPRPLYDVTFLPPPPQQTRGTAQAPNGEGAGSAAAATAPLLDTAGGVGGDTGGGPSSENTGGGASVGVRFAVCGERELRFGHALRGVRWRKAIFGAKAELQTLPCLALNTDGRLLTGSRRGDVYVWQGATVWRRLRGHAGSVHALNVCVEQARGAGFASGGADGKAILWSAAYAQMRVIDCNALCRAKVRAC